MSGASLPLAVTSLGIPSGMAGWQVLQKATPASFSQFTNDPVLKREIAYFEQNAPKATTAKALLADPILQNVVLTAYGLSSEIGMNGLMEKVLNSNPNSTNSFAAQLTSPQYLAIAKAFNYGGTSTPATPATASSANVMLNGVGSLPGDGFTSFSGTFGSVSVQNVNLSAASTPQQIAATLQSAFDKADGGSTAITVQAVGFQLQFTDADGRGTASNFTWTAAGANGSAAQPTNLIAGNTAVAAQGGPNVSNPTFIQQVVSMFTEAEFQQVVGNTSNTLREALYAQQQLPSVTNWYQVIGNAPLANVIQTVLGLPENFGALNITQQSAMLSSKMNIADFQNPTKLSALLDQFVAQSDAQQSSSTSTSTTSISPLSSTNGIIFLSLPTSTTPPDTYTSAASAVVLLNTAVENSET